MTHFSRYFACSECEVHIGIIVEKEEKFFNEDKMGKSTRLTCDMLW